MSATNAILLHFALLLMIMSNEHTIQVLLLLLPRYCLGGQMWFTHTPTTFSTGRNKIQNYIQIEQANRADSA